MRPKIHSLKVSSFERLVVGERITIPLYQFRVPAGFPSPAEDFVEKNIHINDWIIKNRLATYFVTVEGNSMTEQIYHGDSLVVDRSLEPRSGDVVVACIDGELTVKRYVCRNGRHFLVADNPEYPPLEAGVDCEMMIWGVVTYSIRKHR